MGPDLRSSDIVSSECCLLGNWHPSFSEHRPRSPSVGHHDTGTFQAAKDVDASQDVLIDIFVRIEGFFMRLVSYTEVRPTAAMTDAIVKIITEVLSILAIATKEVKQGRSSKYDRHQ